MSDSIFMFQISDMNIMRNLLMNLNIGIIYIYGKNFAKDLKYSNFTDEEIAERYRINRSIEHFIIDDMDDIENSNLYNRNLYKDIEGIGVAKNNSQFSRLFYKNYTDEFNNKRYGEEESEEVVKFIESMTNRYKLMSLIDDNTKYIDNKDNILITHTVCIYHSFNIYKRDTLRVSIYLGVDENNIKYKTRINDSLGIRDIYQISNMNIEDKEIKLYKIHKNFQNKENRNILLEYSIEDTFQISSSYFNVDNNKELYHNLLSGLDSDISRNDINYYISTFFNLMYVIREYIVLKNDEEDVLTPFSINELVFPVIDIPKI